MDKTEYPRMVSDSSLIKEKIRGSRIMKSLAARQRRKAKKAVIEERTENLFSRLRRKRKKS